MKNMIAWINGSLSGSFGRTDVGSRRSPCLESRCGHNWAIMGTGYDCD